VEVNKMETVQNIKIVTITIQTTIDDSNLLSIAQQVAHQLVDEIEAYGEEAYFDENDGILLETEDE